MKKKKKVAAAALLGAAAAALGGVYYGYWEAFKADPKRTDDIMAMPGSELYIPYREASAKNIDRLMAEPFERVSLVSHDGLRLRGRYYEGQSGQPLFLFFHGYRSTAERDGSGGFQLCKKHGWNVLQVDQRGHGESEGKTVTFGIRERYDCLDWVNWAVRRFGEETPIFLVGVSMGASTVLMASGLDLPKQMKGIWADCGFSSTEEVLRHTIRMRSMPEGPAFLAARLGGKLFGSVDLSEAEKKEITSAPDRYRLTWSFKTTTGLERTHSYYFLQTNKDYITINGDGGFYVISSTIKKAAEDAIKVYNGQKITADSPYTTIDQK